VSPVRGVSIIIQSMGVGQQSGIITWRDSRYPDPDVML
jgi:hypothetical protein